MRAIGKMRGEEVEVMLRRYPWFTSARIISSVENERTDPQLELHLLLNPCPTPMLRSVGGVMTETKGDMASNEEIIERFLQKKAGKIVPADDTTEYDAAQQSSIMELPDEMLTEELAQIYMQQGLMKEAEEIYRKLDASNKL